MTDNVIQFPLASEEVRRLCDRAAAHSVPDERLGDLPIEARFRGGIDDLDVARVVLAAERGAEIRQSAGRDRWEIEGPQKFGKAFLTRVVDEMIRTGLAYGLSERVRHDVVGVKVILAPVHFRAFSDDLRASCHVRKCLRLRRVDAGQRDLVDCPSCLNISR